MSVLARMRKLSQYEFYVNALKLRKAMRFLLLRDLGINSRLRNGQSYMKPCRYSKQHVMRAASKRSAWNYRVSTCWSTAQYHSLSKCQSFDYDFPVVKQNKFFRLSEV